MANHDPGQPPSIPSTTAPRFIASTPFQQNRVRAAAIYCSDGRYGDQFDEFLHKELGLPCYDRVALPGGAGAIAGHIESMRSEDAIISEIEFLIASHDLDRLAMIAHEGCGYYLKKLHTAPGSVPLAQQRDLSRAAAVLRRIRPRLEISAHLASIHEGRVIFTDIPITAPE